MVKAVIPDGSLKAIQHKTDLTDEEKAILEEVEDVLVDKTSEIRDLNAKVDALTEDTIRMYK
jgi:hypothetical protein